MNSTRIILYGILVGLIIYAAYLYWGLETVNLPDTRMPQPTENFGSIDANKVVQLAHAMATAEGYFNQAANDIPYRANNPGDLVEGDVGYGTLGAGITVFDSPVTGWNKLYHEAYLMLSGKSSVYSPDMSIAQIAAKYTQTQQASWASNVAYTLGVSADTSLTDWLSA